MTMTYGTRYGFHALPLLAAFAALVSSLYRRANQASFDYRYLFLSFMWPDGQGAAKHCETAHKHINQLEPRGA